MPSKKADLRLDFCDHAAARYAIEHWYYTRTMPVGALVKIGVWESGAFEGVVLFGKGASNNLGKPYALKHYEVCELVRVALRRHTMPVSRILGIALRMLDKQCPGLRLVVTFADAEHHHGGIYQATNWIFLGTTARSENYVIHGRETHGVAARKILSRYPKGDANTITRLRRYVDPDARVVVSSTKYRYVYPLDDEMRRRLLPFALPYPKRGESKDSVAPGSPPGEDGAVPISPLHVS